MPNTEPADLSAILGAHFRKPVVQPARADPDPARYAWDRAINLSPNAVDYLLSVLICDTWPEAHEAGLHAELVRRLRTIKEG